MVAFQLLLGVCLATPASWEVPDELRSLIKTGDIGNTPRQEQEVLIAGGCPPNLTTRAGYHKESQVVLTSKWRRNNITFWEYSQSFWISGGKGVFGSSYLHDWNGDLGTSGQVIDLYHNGNRRFIACTSALAGYGPSDAEWTAWNATAAPTAAKVPSSKCFTGANPASGSCVITSFTLHNEGRAFERLSMTCLNGALFCQYTLTPGRTNLCEPDQELWLCRKVKAGKWVYANNGPDATPSPKPSATAGPHPSLSPTPAPVWPGCQNKTGWLNWYANYYSLFTDEYKREGYDSATYALSGQWGDGNGKDLAEGKAGACHSLIKAKFPTWAIAVIVIGIILVITLVILICSCICKCGCCKDEGR